MRFTIAKKINISSIFLVFLGFCIGGYSIYSSLNGVQISSDIEKVYLPSSSNVNELSMNIVTTVQYVNEYLVLPSEEREKLISSNLKTIEAELDLLSKIVKEPGNEEKLPLVIKMLPTMDAASDIFIKTSKDTMKIAVSINEVGNKFTQFVEVYSKSVDDFYDVTLKEVIKQMGLGNTAFVNQLLENLDIINGITGNLSTIKELHAYAVFNNTNRDAVKITELLQSIEKSMNAIESTVKTEANSKKIKAYISQLRELMELSKQTQGAIRTFEGMAKNLSSSSEEMSKCLTALSDRIKFVLNREIVASSAGQTSSLAVATILLLVLAIFGIAIMIFLSRAVTSQISMFVKTVGDLTSGDGDLTKRIKAKNNDELNDLAVNFNKFIENVQYIIVEVKSSSDEVASGNNQLAATMEELSSTFDSQTQQISDMVNSLESVEQTSKEAFNDLTENMRTLDKTTELTNRGASELNGIKVSVEEISRQTSELSVTIGKLTESATHIGDILSVINDIADQTNLLALNAAIEAARAGDAGRGFAVVADEVRKLAERTQKATAEIDLIVNSLQKESDNAAVVMKRASDTVLTGVEKIVHTAEGFNEVVNGVTDVNANVKIVTTSVGTQNEGIQRVVDNSQAIASGVEESNAAVNEVNSTVSHLQQRTENLKTLVARFKV